MDRRVADLFAVHPDVSKVTFTGSVETGRIVYEAKAKIGASDSRTWWQESDDRHGRC